MNDCDFIVISQADIVKYNEYSKLPIDRIELFRDQVFPRMVYFKEGFHSPLDLINFFQFGKFFNDANDIERRNLLNIWNLPGLSGIHLANYLLKYGIKTRIVNNIDAEWDIFCEFYENNTIPPLVGISTTFFLSYLEIKRLSVKLRNYDSGMEIVLGGAFINEQAMNNNVASFEKPMRKHKINYIVHSFNSEVNLKDLIMKKKRDEKIDEVYNMAYIEHGDFVNGAFKTTEVEWNNPVLNEVSALWDMLETPFLNHTMQMRTSSGCSFSCAFCSYPQTAGGFYTMSCVNVEEHLIKILNITGVNKIIFIDDTFNVPIKRFKELCRIFSKFNFEWFSFLRVQYIDDEIANLMKDSGCRGVYLGVESANDTILKNMNKKASSIKYLKGIESLKKCGIKSMAAFVIGFPGEMEETINENIKFIETSGIDYFTLKEFYYMKQTPVYRDREKYGLSGIGSNWSHNTMDYQRAADIKIEMFKNIKNSIFIDADTSLWYLAYLYDRGFTFDDISEIQKAINNIVLDELDGNYDDNSAAIDSLKDLFPYNIPCLK